MGGQAVGLWRARDCRQVQIVDYSMTNPGATPSGMVESPPGVTTGGRWRSTRSRKRLVAIALCVILAVTIGISLAVTQLSSSPTYPIHPTKYVRYVGVHELHAPGTYAEIDQFARYIGRQPNLVSYYENWNVPFQSGFANLAAERGALTLAQMDPENVSVASIASGRYDAYLRTYADAVRAFGKPVIMSFGHEMNGDWYSWGSRGTRPAVFVRAWRHIVDVFRAKGAENVIWLWIVNVTDANNNIPDPSPWWPGRKYVTWVGIDGYFYLQSQSFAQLFGPTIVDVRQLTQAPILIAETGAEQTTNQASKISEIFAGVRSYGLLGFVWFDENTQGRSWSINNPAAFSMLRRDTASFMQPLTKKPAGSPSPAGSSP